MKEKIQFFAQLQELCLSVCEGISYLSGHREDSAVRADIREGISVLASYLAGEGLMGPGMADRWRGYEAAFSADAGGEGADLQALGRQIAGEFSQVVSAALQKLVRGTEALERAEAEAVFRYCGRAGRASAAVYQLLFDACMKSSRSAPQEPFDYTLKMLEEQPGLLSGEDAPHPGYRYEAAEQRVFDRCPVCGGEGAPYYRAFAYFQADFAPPHLPVKLWMRCGGCGNLYTWKYPEALLAGPREPGYRFPAPGPREGVTAAADLGALSDWGDILRSARAYTHGDTLLEVGVGRGDLIAVALELGYDVEAVELVEETAQQTADLLGLPVWNGDFLSYETDKAYSVITMGDVLEHMTDPRLALEKAFRLLREDGVLWLSTPNFESAFSRLRKFADPMWNEPYHIVYFSRRGLARLAEECGFFPREYRVSRRYSGSMEWIFTKGKGGRG